MGKVGDGRLGKGGERLGEREKGKQAVIYTCIRQLRGQRFEIQHPRKDISGMLPWG